MSNPTTGLTSLQDHKNISPPAAPHNHFSNMLENGISQLMQFRQAAAAHAHANAQADLLARLGRPVPRLPPLPLPFPLFGPGGMKFPQSVHPSFADHVRARFPGFPPLVMPSRAQMDPGSLQLTPVSVPDFGQTSPRHMYQDDQQLSPNGKSIYKYHNLASSIHFTGTYECNREVGMSRTQECLNFCSPFVRIWFRLSSVLLLPCPK